MSTFIDFIFFCEYCDSQLKTVSSLNQHKKTNKKCLLSRGNKLPTFDCNICKKGFPLKSSLQRHKESCKGMIISAPNSAGGPQISDVLLIPWSLSNEDLDHIFCENVTRATVLQGQKGIANIVAKHIVSNSDGEMYIVLDKSRYKGQYIENGELVNDFGFNNLIEKIYYSVKKYTIGICLTPENSDETLSEGSHLSSGLSSILDLRNNSKTFKDELIACMYSSN